MVRTVFNRIETASENIEFSVKVSMIEIYMGENQRSNGSY